jgi:hypothetical protein
MTKKKEALVELLSARGLRGYLTLVKCRLLGRSLVEAPLTNTSVPEPAKSSHHNSSSMEVDGSDFKYISNS